MVSLAMLFVSYDKDVIMSGYYNNEQELIKQLRNSGYILDNGALKKGYVSNSDFKLYHKTIQYLILNNPSVNNKSSFSHCFKNYNHKDCKINYHKPRQKPESYKSLIQSLDKDGYNNKTPIIVDKNWVIIDGYHRMEYFVEREIDKNTKILVLRILK